MTQWQYQVDEFDFNTDDALETWLNGKGAEGWETTNFDFNGTHVVVIFKRPVAAP